jgi:hypothetical protein
VKDDTRREALLQSISQARFRETKDGTYVRGDQVLCVQVKAERDAWRNERFRHAADRAAAQPERDTLEKFAGQFPGGLQPRIDDNRTTIPNVYDHASGGAAERLRQLEGMARQQE